VNYIDLWGLKTVVFSLLVTLFDRHLFIGVQTEDGTIVTKSLYPENKLEAVQDAVTGGTQPAKLEHNKSDELETATKYFSNEPLPAFKKMEAIIAPPSGMSQENFDQIVLKAAENYPVNERPYNTTRGFNSNTYVDDVIESTGARMPDIKGATQQNWGEQCSK
jgi:hypothetical protein